MSSIERREQWLRKNECFVKVISTRQWKLLSSNNDEVKWVELGLN